MSVDSASRSEDSLDGKIRILKWFKLIKKEKISVKPFNRRLSFVNRLYKSFMKKGDIYTNEE